MVGCVGDDPSGQALVGSLQAFGVDTSTVRIETSGPTGSAFITVSASGDNTIVVHRGRGANPALSPQHCRDCEPFIAQANVLVAQLETPLECVMKAFQIARWHRVMTILNPAPAAPVPRQLLEMADYPVPNVTEAASIRPALEGAGMRGSLRTCGRRFARCRPA